MKKYLEDFWNEVEELHQKKLIRALIFGLLVLLISSCHSTKQVVVQREIDQPQIVKKSLHPFLLKDHPRIAVGDPISVYNEYEIIVYKKIPKIEKSLKNGIIVYNDISTIIDYDVPEGKRGTISSITYGVGGNANQITVDFPSNSDGEIQSYKFDLQANGSFALNPNVNFIVKGEPYDLQVGIAAPVRYKCRLMADKTFDSNEEMVGNVATDAEIPQGEKKIEE